MKNAKTKYVRAVRRHLACSFTAKQRITNHLTAALSELDTAATYHDIILAYGEPQAVAQAYLDNLSPAELHHFDKWKKRALLAVIIIPLVITLVIHICDCLSYRKPIIVEVKGNEQIITF